MRHNIFGTFVANHHVECPLTSKIHTFMKDVECPLTRKMLSVNSKDVECPLTHKMGLSVNPQNEIVARCPSYMKVEEALAGLPPFDYRSSGHEYSRS